jgi:hypothetical protein
MVLILPLLLLAVLGYLWWSRRGSTLTRTCRWRQDRRQGWRCAACGATATGQEPRDCLRPPQA